jgi:N-methylhydantoinase B
MDLAFSRAAFSPVIAEANDRSDGIYDAIDGALIAQGAGGLPVFVGTMQFSTRTLIARIASGETAAPEPGDTYIVNDPYLGGTHLMDVRFARPYWRKGEIFCWLSNTGHWPDVGGAVPGGFSASATAVEQEGLRLPPVKLFKRGEMDREIYAIICSNIPRARAAHRRRQGAGGGAGYRRGAARRAARPLWRRVVRAAIAALRDRAAEQMRAAIRAIPEGRWEGVAWVDSDGVVDAPLEIRLAVTREGDRLGFDFKGSSPPCIGPMNSVRATTFSSVYLAMRHLFPETADQRRRLRAAGDRRDRRHFPRRAISAPRFGLRGGSQSQRIAEAVFAALVEAIAGQRDGRAGGQLSGKLGARRI